MALLSGSGEGNITVSKKEEKGSRFDGLFGAVKAVKQDDENLDVQTSEHSNTQTSENLNIQTSEHRNIQLSKSKDPHYQRTTIYIPKPLHRKLKAIAAEDDREISDIVETLVQDWIEERNTSRNP